jgi:predicted kinase
MGIVFLGVPGMLDTLGMPIHADRQAARRVAAQSDFRTIHLEDPRIAAGGAVSRRDAGAGDETKLHQTARVVGG